MMGSRSSWALLLTAAQSLAACQHAARGEARAAASPQAPSEAPAQPARHPSPEQAKPAEAEPSAVPQAHISQPSKLLDPGGKPLRVLTGLASYYSDKLSGRATASGAPYLPEAFTAAHRSLPFGTLVRVTRLDNGAHVLVEVNDRGPFGSRGRIIDLSRRAAEELGMLRAGVVRVRVEVLRLGAPAGR